MSDPVLTAEQVKNWRDGCKIRAQRYQVEVLDLCDSHEQLRAERDKERDEANDWALVADGVKHDWRCCHGEAGALVCLRCQVEALEARLLASATPEQAKSENRLWWALMEWEASMSMLLKEGGAISQEAEQDIRRIRDMRQQAWPTKESRQKFYEAFELPAAPPLEST